MNAVSKADQQVARIARRLPRVDRWILVVSLTALLLSLPVLSVFSFVLQPAGEVWQHLAETVLKDYVVNSLILMMGVAVGTLAIGVPTAWLTSMCEFPGRRLFQWTLLLPMAMPAYIIAYTYTGMLDFAGPVQTTLRHWLGWSYGDYWFPEVRSITGAIVMLSLVLYPYVYLLARAAFLEQSGGVLEASRTLGAHAWQSFFRVALPLARPAVVTGLSLALMETLADYGTVQYFGISTFTTGIFRTWFGLGDSAAAAQLSSLLLTFVFALLLLERWSRRRARYHHTGGRYSRPHRTRLHGPLRTLAMLVCVSPLLLGFLLPAGQLLIWAVRTGAEILNVQFFNLAWHSLVLAAAAAVIALVLALLMGYGKRLRPVPVVRFAVRVAGMGYAIPGPVVAVGVMLPFAWMDNAIDTWARSLFGHSTGLLFSGTVFILLFAYVVRFLAVSLNTVDAGLTKVKPSMDDAARSLGLGPAALLRKVHVPMMRGTLLTALLLVFVDVLKELPATLVLRPFNFNTLAVRAFELAADERLAESASAALTIVIVGIVPVLLLSRSIDRRGSGDASAA